MTVSSQETTQGWRAAAELHDLRVQLDERTPLYFQYIPPGRFRMGSRGEYADEEPVHQVEISRGFYMATFPVTQSQWRGLIQCVPPNDLNSDPSHFKGDLRPVEQVNWFDASKWCRLLTKSGLLRKATDRGGDRVELERPVVYLPTEAQWEYACRAGKETEYYTGDGIAALDAAGWYDGNAGSQTHDVGDTKVPNAFGLYDMHGNVWEWCRDAWDENAYKKRVDGVRNPRVFAADIGQSKKNADRVFRGGSWYGTAGGCRAACRFRWGPDYRSCSRGFRVCLFSGPSCPAAGVT